MKKVFLITSPVALFSLMIAGTLTFFNLQESTVEIIFSIVGVLFFICGLFTIISLIVNKNSKRKIYFIFMEIAIILLIIFINTAFTNIRFIDISLLLIAFYLTDVYDENLRITIKYIKNTGSFYLYS